MFVYVQRAFGFVFLLAAYHVFTTQRREVAVAALNWYMAALATAGIAAFAYRSLFHNVLVRRKPTGRPRRTGSTSSSPRS